MSQFSSFSEFFEKATGHDPYPYQTRLANEGQTLPSLVSVPTGLGKTAAAILGWLWRRRFADSDTRSMTPRRLVYCLPMRVLVEQTRDNARAWLDNLGILATEAPARHPPEKIAVHVLMGGDLEIDWDRWPDRDQILIGTQDMLLSRALNRGYAMSRFRWPIHFALLNNDCQWIMDEVQLMGNGLATTAQLQAFRRVLGTLGVTHSTWMSATMRSDWLSTVDFDLVLDAPGMLGIDGEDTRHPALKPRFGATKRLESAPFLASTDGKTEATLILERHRPGTRSLVIVNTVKRAQGVYDALTKKKPRPAADLVLLHSRFRPLDRALQMNRLLAEPKDGGTIAVCTQVVEAGVDVSARLLITDLAPWPSLVQRFGRCNRGGEFNEKAEAEVIWISPAGFDDDKKLRPYTGDDLRLAAEFLGDLSDASPGSLPGVESAMTYTHVPRRKDLVELFDTTPDLAGADVDVSRFIRESDDHDVQVFWRDIDDEAEPAASEVEPDRDELCSVSVGKFRDWLKKDHSAWRWDHLERAWRRIRSDDIYPGLVLLLRSEEGGYSPERGWTGSEKRTPSIAKEAPPLPAEANDDDRLAEHRAWVTVAEHTNRVMIELSALLDSQAPALAPWRSSLEQAARWHDAGKAHPEFQGALGERPGPGLWGKAPSMGRYERRGFRHELASALAMLTNGKSDLAAYLAAAHHGKVRLSIRSLPHETHPTGDPGGLFARGVWDGETLPAVDLGGGVTAPETQLALSYMKLGEDKDTGPSWLARMLSLRDSPALGPFRLALLEAILRVADWRGSGAVKKDGEKED